MYSASDSDFPFSLDEPFDFTQGPSMTSDTMMTDPLDISGLSTFAVDYLDFPFPESLSSPSPSSSTAFSEENQVQVALQVQDEDALVSVSTTFYPGSMDQHGPAEVAFLSCDSVFFYVHHHIVLGASENGFNHLLERQNKGNIIPLPDSSPVLNVVFHAIYNLPCATYGPSFQTLSVAVDALEMYGVSLQKVLSSPSPLFTLFIAHASSSPLELYSLAAHNDLSDLAISTSPYLLSISLSEVTDEIARRVGPSYLRRLFFLHLGRIDAFKRILLPPPNPHTPNRTCSVSDLNGLGRAWALASAYLAWDARPDISGAMIEKTLTPLKRHLHCEMCRKALKDRVNSLVAEWSQVKRTI